MSFIYVSVCTCVRVARPRVRDGKPAEVVCGYFGDWFYRVGNGTRDLPPPSASPLSLSSISDIARVRERASDLLNISRRIVLPHFETRTYLVREMPMISSREVLLVDEDSEK
jgi:hypothetical protein